MSMSHVMSKVLLCERNDLQQIQAGSAGGEAEDARGEMRKDSGLVQTYVSKTIRPPLSHAKIAGVVALLSWCSSHPWMVAQT